MALTHITEFLSAYLDNELDANTESRVKIHLAGCPECQKEERLLTASWNLLASVETVQPSPDFKVRFWERVRMEEEKEASCLSFPRLVPVMAGMVGVWVAGVGLGSYLFLRSPQAQRTFNFSLKQNSLFNDVPSLGNAYVKRMPPENS